MTVKAEFPDGTVRDVPSVTREIKSREIGRPNSIFEEVPADDPEWRFLPAMGDRWIARPRDD
jgi:hypothetical protein